MKNKGGKRGISSGVWAILLILIFLLAVGGMLAVQTGGAGKVACIYRDGRLVRRIDLAVVTSEYRFTIETDAGWNEISVRPGEICVLDADCADHTCIKQGWLKGGVTPIVCLPHKLVIQFKDAPENAPADEELFDAVAGCKVLHTRRNE